MKGARFRIGWLVAGIAGVVGVLAALGLASPVPAGTRADARPASPRPAPTQPSIETPAPVEESEDPQHPGLALATPLEDPSGHALDAFHAALRRAERGEGRARVLTYGASHTACDHLPGHLRERLQARFGDGGRGFTVPAWPSDRYSYWTWGATVDEGEGWDRVRLGLSRGDADYYGISGLIFDSHGREARARVSAAQRGVGSSADRISVLFLAGPGAGHLEVSIDGEVRDTIDTAHTAAAAGQVEFDVEEGGHVVELRAVPGAPVRLYGLSFERKGPGVVVDNVGLTGARARFHSKWREPVYSAQVRARAPDLVVLWYGGNEGNDLDQPMRVTRQEMSGAFDKLLAAAGDTSCVVLGAADKPLERDGEWVHRERTDRINELQRDLAFSRGCAFFDTVAFMGGPLSMLEWVSADPPLGRDDHIHFTALGYERLADVLIAELLAGY